MTSYHGGGETGYIGQHREERLLSNNFEMTNMEQRDRDEIIREFTQSTRSFNCGAMAVFAISVPFTLFFSSDLNAAQTIFYIYYVLLFLVNCSFYGVGYRTKENWVKMRLFAVYLPLLAGLGLQMATLGLFLSKLDQMHEVINNSYPVLPEDLQNSTVYVALSFLLLIMPPLFHQLSFFAYVRELSLYYNSKGKGNSAVQTGAPDTNNANDQQN